MLHDLSEVRFQHLGEFADLATEPRGELLLEPDLAEFIGELDR